MDNPSIFVPGAVSSLQDFLGIIERFVEEYRTTLNGLDVGMVVSNLRGLGVKSYIVDWVDSDVKTTCFIIKQMFDVSVQHATAILSYEVATFFMYAIWSDEIPDVEYAMRVAMRITDILYSSLPDTRDIASIIDRVHWKSNGDVFAWLALAMPDEVLRAVISDGMVMNSRNVPGHGGHVFAFLSNYHVFRHRTPAPHNQVLLTAGEFIVEMYRQYAVLNFTPGADDVGPYNEDDNPGNATCYVLLLNMMDETNWHVNVASYDEHPIYLACISAGMANVTDTVDWVALRNFFYSLMEGPGPELDVMRIHSFVMEFSTCTMDRDMKSNLGFFMPELGRMVTRNCNTRNLYGRIIHSTDEFMSRVYMPRVSDMFW